MTELRARQLVARSRSNARHVEQGIEVQHEDLDVLDNVGMDRHRPMDRPFIRVNRQTQVVKGDIVCGLFRHEHPPCIGSTYAQLALPDGHIGSEKTQ
jgi:hypothetical protein